MDKDKQTFSAYVIKGKEQTLRTSEKKEKTSDSYVCIYEGSKQICTSTFKYAYSAQKNTISQMKEMLD